ncbi:hypothetical protein WA158_000657 [Blastocystis sp. Blastoise]
MQSCILGMPSPGTFGMNLISTGKEYRRYNTQPLHKMDQYNPIFHEIGPNSSMPVSTLESKEIHDGKEDDYVDRSKTFGKDAVPQGNGALIRARAAGKGVMKAAGPEEDKIDGEDRQYKVLNPCKPRRKSGRGIIPNKSEINKFENNQGSGIGDAIKNKVKDMYQRNVLDIRDAIVDKKANRKARDALAILAQYVGDGHHDLDDEFKRFYEHKIKRGGKIPISVASAIMNAIKNKKMIINPKLRRMLRPSIIPKYIDLDSAQSGDGILRVKRGGGFWDSFTTIAPSLLGVVDKGMDSFAKGRKAYYDTHLAQQSSELNDMEFEMEKLKRQQALNEMKKQIGNGIVMGTINDGYDTVERQSELLDQEVQPLRDLHSMKQQLRKNLPVRQPPPPAAPIQPQPEIEPELNVDTFDIPQNDTPRHPQTQQPPQPYKPMSRDEQSYPYKIYGFPQNDKEKVDRKWKEDERDKRIAARRAKRRGYGGRVKLSKEEFLERMRRGKEAKKKRGGDLPPIVSAYTDFVIPAQVAQRKRKVAKNDLKQLQIIKQKMDNNEILDRGEQMFWKEKKYMLSKNSGEGIW